MNETLRIILLILAALAFLWFLVKFLLDWEKDEVVRSSSRTMNTSSSATMPAASAATSTASAARTARPAATTTRASTSSSTASTATRKPRAAASTATRKKDDLTKVEGIGPKINELLNAAGIYSFENLANAPVAKLRAILEDAGSRFQMHDPSTWAQQSRIAASGDWDKLEALQDRLNGGRS